MHTVFALLCFVVVIHWLIFPYPLGLLHWHCGNLTIAPVPAKQPWWIWINTSCEFIMNDCITTTKQSTTKPCAYFLGYTVQRKYSLGARIHHGWTSNSSTISLDESIKLMCARHVMNHANFFNSIQSKHNKVKENLSCGKYCNTSTYNALNIYHRTIWLWPEQLCIDDKSHAKQHS